MTSERPVKPVGHHTATGTMRHPSAPRRTAALGLAALVTATAAGLGALFLDDAPDSRTVAIVNTDTGATVEGEAIRAGESLIENLEANQDFDWQVVSADEAETGSYFATVTVPEDFSAAVASVWGATPRQATLDLDVAGSDEAASLALSEVVSTQVGADGVADLLTDMSKSRSTFQQAGMAAGLLAAGTSAADDAAQQLTEGADTLLPYLETARSGAVQLLGVADQVAGVVDETAGTANDLADRLSALGFTLGEANDGAVQMRTRIDEAIRILAATPVAPEVVPALQQVSSDLGLLSGQLTSVPGLLGEQVGPDTDLGELVRVAMGQLTDASAELSSGARQLNDGIVPIADQAPEMLAGATTQIVDGFAKLKALSGRLSTDLNAGVAAMPARSAVQQAQLATVLADPVAVSRSVTAPTSILTDRHLAVGFGCTTALLAAVVAWMGLRRSNVQRAS
ncbi:hypothetical protein [Rhodococcus tibetensis]|uniref:YhgE/Pip domain-containing protein n=1 Tax=Rhodococcus tibetensis TaxID=2965064 RepID=A0ABT1QJ55_9NOCA|nr:hypothetical protein [Rhodococcus sp. FXJ9.536]MCQ4121678.1 hypothetical protein [Rhodococcus sp. FXJ9.536]